MDLFTNLGIHFVPHFAPIHYLPFIARSRALKSKPALLRDGFTQSHFRSRSRKHDIDRGFGEYAFLTLSRSPRIVMAKLKAGFPHVAVNVPVEAFHDTRFELCRYNVAMSRRKPTSPLGGFPESDTNGRYYEDKTLPIARTVDDKRRLLEMHYPKGTMIEVLVYNQLELPGNTTITCYSQQDLDLAQNVLDATQAHWATGLSAPPGEYNRNGYYVQIAQDFIECALSDPFWRGNGIEFDKI